MRLKIGDKTYRLRGPDELTLGDWGPINSEPWPDDPAKAHDHLVGIIARLTTAPASKIRKARVGDLEGAVGMITDVLDKAMRASKADPVTEFTHDGKRYIVPADLEDVEFERWHAFTNVLKGVDKEVDAYAYALACLCLGPDEFDVGQLTPLAESMKGAPLLQSLGVCAFFFASSERYRNAMMGWSRSLLTSALRLPVLTASHPATA